MIPPTLIPHTIGREWLMREREREREREVWLTFNLHSCSEALGEAAGLAHLLHVHWVAADGAGPVIAALVVPAHLHRPTKEALAGFAADDPVVLPEGCLLCRCLPAHCTQAAGDGRGLLGPRQLESRGGGTCGDLWPIVVPQGVGVGLWRAGREQLATEGTGR